MRHELAAEADRLNQRIERVRWGDRGLFAAEVPLRLHERGTDQGHGLGGPGFHPRFESYLRDAGVCFCEATFPDGTPRQHACDRRFENTPAGFRGSRFENHPRRLKRALRQLRLLAPAEFDAIYLMIARSRSWHETFALINAGRYSRGMEPYSESDFMVLTIAGFDKLIELF